MIPSYRSLLFSGLLTACLFSARADEIVNSTADSGTGSLRDAIQNASPGDTITFDMTLDGQTITLTSGQLLIGKALTIDASDLPSGITIARTSLTPARIFSVVQPGVILDSLTIENGKAPDATASTIPENGGGILNGAGGLTLRRCTIRNCEAGDGHPANNYGGGGGGIMNNGTLVIEECTFYNNAAGDGHDDGSGGSGGAINHNTGSLTVTNSTFTGNRAGSGDPDGDGTGGYGGGISAGGSGSNGNDNDTLTLISTTITGNEAGAGASDPGRGGGLYVNSLNEGVTLENTIIAGNRIGPVPAANAARSDIDIPAPTIVPVTTNGVNIIGIRDGAAGSFPAPTNPGDPNTNGDIVGDIASPIDPQLEALADNGGPTLTMSPAPTSPAIDPLGGDISPSVPTDQRGLPRLSFEKVDVGALEFGAEDQAERDRIEALRKKLTRQISSLRKKVRIAKRKKQVAKLKRLKKKLSKKKRQLRRL